MSLSHALRSLDHDDIDVIYKSLPFIKTLSHNRGTHNTPLESRQQSLAEAFLLARDSFTLTHDILREKNKQIDILTGVASVTSSRSSNESSDILKNSNKLASTHHRSLDQQNNQEFDTDVENLFRHSLSSLPPLITLGGNVVDREDTTLMVTTPITDKGKKVPQKKDLGAAIAVFSSTPSMSEGFDNDDEEDDDEDDEDFETQQRRSRGTLLAAAKSYSSFKSDKTQGRSSSRKRNTTTPSSSFATSAPDSSYGIVIPQRTTSHQHLDYYQNFGQDRHSYDKSSKPSPNLDNSENSDSTTVSDKTETDSSQILSPDQTENFDSIFYPVLSELNLLSFIEHDYDNTNTSEINRHDRNPRSMSTPDLLYAAEKSQDAGAEETLYTTPYMDTTSSLSVSGQHSDSETSIPVPARYDSIGLNDETSMNNSSVKNIYWTPEQLDSYSTPPQHPQETFSKQSIPVPQNAASHIPNPSPSLRKKQGKSKQRGSVPAVFALDPPETTTLQEGSSKVSTTAVGPSWSGTLDPAALEAASRTRRKHRQHKRDKSYKNLSATGGLQLAKESSRNKGKGKLPLSVSAPRISAAQNRKTMASASTPDLVHSKPFLTGETDDQRHGEQTQKGERSQLTEHLERMEPDPHTDETRPISHHETKVHDSRRSKSHGHRSKKKKRHYISSEELNRKLPPTPKTAARQKAKQEERENELIKHVPQVAYIPPKTVDLYNPTNDYLPQYLRRTYNYWRWTLNSPVYNVPERYAVWVCIHLRHPTLWYHVQNVINLADDGKFKTCEEVNAYILRKATGHIKAQEEIARYEFNQLTQPEKLSVVMFNANFLRIFNKIRHFFHPDRLAIQYYDRISSKIRNRLNVNFYEHYAIPGAITSRSYLRSRSEGHEDGLSKSSTDRNNNTDSNNTSSSSNNNLSSDNNISTSNYLISKTQKIRDAGGTNGIISLQANPEFWHPSASSKIPAKPFISLEALMVMAEQVDDAYNPIRATTTKPSFFNQLLLMGRHKDDKKAEK